MKAQLYKNKGGLSSSQSMACIEKTVIDDDKNTWVFQDYLNEPNFGQINKKTQQENQAILNHFHDDPEKS